MTDKNKNQEIKDFLQSLKEFAITVGEECPEGHRRDARSGACLPLGPTDYTAFTRSVNDDQGDEWRGLKDKTNVTFAGADEADLTDAVDMPELESCGEGMTFSFVQKKCIPLGEAEAEDEGALAFVEEAEWDDILEMEGEFAKKLTYQNRKALPSSSFGLPSMRAFPLHDCNHVRNAMARFSQAKGLSSAQKSTLKSKIMSKAKSCGIDVKKFASASEEVESSAALPYKKEKALPDSAFGVPGKRKFPLNDCSHVRNAMARFNQAKGLTAGEKATLRRKILVKAKACGINVKNFAKAHTDAEFLEVSQELLVATQQEVQKRVLKDYAQNPQQGPCPPGMMWDMKGKRCMKEKSYLDTVLGSTPEIVALDPAGRRDTLNFKCPPGQMFDFNNRTCIPLNSDDKQSFNPGSSASVEEGVNNYLAPNPPGKPAKLPSDCPKGTIWDENLEKCKPLDSNKKTVSSVENAGREGLTIEVPGKVKLPYDCPAGTIWDPNRRTCTPLSTDQKNRPTGSPGPYNPKNVASIENQVGNMSLASIIHNLDIIIREEVLAGRNEKAHIAAKDLPNAAFPPSLVTEDRRSLMHHSADVRDPYDDETVDVSRLRNALARVNGIDGYSDRAVSDALRHLLEHAQEIIKNYLVKH